MSVMFKLLQVRLDDEADKMLDELSKEMLRTRSDVVRYLIKKTHTTLSKKEDGNEG
jgi:predicted DNA-binding protein